MLNEHKIIGFVATKDRERAMRFYVEVLGLTVSCEDQFALEVMSGGNRIRIAGAEKFEPLPFTVLGWEIESDISQVAAHLKSRGVVFERFSFLEQDELGIWNSPSGARVAWFKDPDGNMLSLSKHA